MFSEDSDWEMGGEDSRLCESCGEQPSTVHVTRIENGTVSHSHLCQTCAEELGEQNDGTAVMFAVPAGRSDITIKYVPPLGLELTYWLNLGGWVGLLIAGLGWLRFSAPVAPLNESRPAGC